MGGFQAVWNGGAAPIVRAAAFAPAPELAPIAGGGCGFDWNQIQYQEFLNTDPAYGIPGGVHQSPAVFTKPPRPGFFHFILALSLYQIASNAFTYAAFLVPPNFASPNTIKFLFKGDGVGLTLVPDSMPATGVRLLGSFSGTTQSGQHIGIFTPSTIVVPPGWALLICRDDQQASTSSGAILNLQVAFAELPIGTEIPCL